ncbi:MAG TPA: NAD+ synthase [Verrucomicrobiota bacterium]|nr:NAD+ synthase [Verrucomicrobiota bacterium]HNU51861.1 NAD+ synthase [Verrucomicrobiota bacterium]
MKIAVAQINTTVGDWAGNEGRIRAAYARGVAAGADLVVVPELAIPGYPPRDLLLRRGFVEANLAVLDRLRQATGRTGLLVGYVDWNRRMPGRNLANAVALLHEGRVLARRTKTLLPSYDVFDEDRYFEPAQENAPVRYLGRALGLTICEDLWNDEGFWQDRRYRRDPVADLVAAGADLLCNLSASPWHLGKNRVRHAMLASLAAKSRCPLVYCNLVGGNDELVFDGCSRVLTADGVLVARGRRFEEDFMVVDPDAGSAVKEDLGSDEEKLHGALVLGLRDYLGKCGVKSVVLGLSGGIDSALTACLAAEAVGADRVLGVSLPSEFSSAGSLEDARLLAVNLGIRYAVLPIRAGFEALRRELAPLFAGRAEDVTEENLQARLRGVLLMALSNKLGALLLTTGNKSEMAVGYCTLYGDMCGGLAVISDLPKTMVYRVARWINRDREIIPAASITKPPSAELRPNQTDQDSLPPYDVLDGILEAYVVEGRSVAEILGLGFPEGFVRQVVGLIDQSEFKRRQAAPGLKVTSKAFGVGRRIPIAQRYREA